MVYCLVTSLKMTFEYTQSVSNIFRELKVHESFSRLFRTSSHGII